VGKKADQAERVLRKRGLDVNRESAYSDTVAEGLVISQEPRSETLFRGDVVTIVASLGPELVEVPQVRAVGVDDATAQHEAAGVGVVTEEAPGYLGLGYVYESDPEGGSMVPRGSTITLYLV
jgi:serine/threonine-protein kinase